MDAIARVGDGEVLARFVDDLAILEKSQEQQLIAAHTLLKQDVTDVSERVDARFNAFGQETVQRLTQLEGFMSHATSHGIPQAERSGPPAGYGCGGYQIRVPDPHAWKFESTQRR